MSNSPPFTGSFLEANIMLMRLLSLFSFIAIGCSKLELIGYGMISIFNSSFNSFSTRFARALEGETTLSALLIKNNSAFLLSQSFKPIFL